LALFSIGITDHFVITQAAKFTAGKWANWKDKTDEEVAQTYWAVLKELPSLFEKVDGDVRDSLTVATDTCLRNLQLHLEAVIDSLDSASRSGRNVRIAIGVLRQAQATSRIEAKVKRRSARELERRERAAAQRPGGGTPRWHGFAYATVLLAMVGGAGWLFRDIGSPTPGIVKERAPATPNPAKEAIAEAVRLYPGLNKKDSALNRKFVELYREAQTNDPGLLTKSDWPLTLVARAVAAIPHTTDTPRGGKSRRQ
jgi:hypothetical protein